MACSALVLATFLVASHDGKGPRDEGDSKDPRDEGVRDSTQHKCQRVPRSIHDHTDCMDSGARMIDRHRRQVRRKGRPYDDHPSPYSCGATQLQHLNVLLG